MRGDTAPNQVPTPTYPGWPVAPGWISNAYGNGYGNPAYNYSYGYGYMSPQAVGAASHAVHQVTGYVDQSQPYFQDQGGYFSSVPAVYSQYGEREWYAQTPTQYADPAAQYAPADWSHWSAGPMGQQAGQERHAGGPRFDRHRKSGAMKSWR